MIVLCSELDLDVDSAGQIELHQGIDRLGGRAVDINDAAMGARFEMFA